MPSPDTNLPPIAAARIDLAATLRRAIGDTGKLDEHFGGFRIQVYHGGGFPWNGVFAALLYHDFRVYVTRRKADIIIEASA